MNKELLFKCIMNNRKLLDSNFGLVKEPNICVNKIPRSNLYEMSGVLCNDKNIMYVSSIDSSNNYRVRNMYDIGEGLSKTLRSDDQGFREYTRNEYVRELTLFVKNSIVFINAKLDVEINIHELCALFIMELNNYSVIFVDDKCNYDNEQALTYLKLKSEIFNSKDIPFYLKLKQDKLRLNDTGILVNRQINKVYFATKDYLEEDIKNKLDYGYNINCFKLNDMISHIKTSVNSILKNSFYVHLQETALVSNLKMMSINIIELEEPLIGDLPLADYSPTNIVKVGDQVYRNFIKEYKGAEDENQEQKPEMNLGMVNGIEIPTLFDIASYFRDEYLLCIVNLVNDYFIDRCLPNRYMLQDLALVSYNEENYVIIKPESGTLQTRVCIINKDYEEIYKTLIVNNSIKSNSIINEDFFEEVSVSESEDKVEYVNLYKKITLYTLSRCLSVDSIRFDKDTIKQFMGRYLTESENILLQSRYKSIFESLIKSKINPFGSDVQVSTVNAFGKPRSIESKSNEYIIHL